MMIQNETINLLNCHSKWQVTNKQRTSSESDRIESLSCVSNAKKTKHFKTIGLLINFRLQLIIDYIYQQQKQ